MSEQDGALHLVAAGFEDRERAAAAEAALRTILDVEGPDVALHEAGGSPDFVKGYQLLLGARIRAARLPEAEAVLRRYGGEVLTDIPAAWAEL